MLTTIARAAALAFFMLPFAWAGQSSAHEGVTTSAKIKPVVEVAFVLDTTGSMGPLIESAKRKIWSIATAIVDANPEAEIRMGLVAYRDIGDDYVTKTFNICGARRLGGQPLGVAVSEWIDPGRQQFAVFIGPGAGLGEADDAP